MGLLDVVLHALNFLSPALGLGLIAPALAKLLWRQHLRSVPWHELARWTFLAGTVPLLAGLVITGRDGRMATYVCMVAASALALWWRGWLRAGRR